MSPASFWVVRGCGVAESSLSCSTLEVCTADVLKAEYMIVVHVEYHELIIKPTHVERSDDFTGIMSSGPIMLHC